MWFFHEPKFEYESIFPDYDAAWAGHKYFAYDLVANLKPKVIVELGSYKGTSLFAFAQAIKDHKLKTELYGVDSWQGDDHTGFYGQDIYKKVSSIAKKQYGTVRLKLVKKFFDDAVTDFTDKSIDVLHIDGLHTYEAVKHDFKTWLPKVTDDGLILFHDTAYTKRGFGVYKFWDEIKHKYAVIAFKHSNGLGILCRDTALFTKLKNEEANWNKYYAAAYMNDYLSRGVSVQTFDTMTDKQKKQLVTTATADLKNKEIEELKLELKQTKKILAGTMHQLQDIYDSRFFKLWQSYCNARDSLRSLLFFTRSSKHN